MEGGDLSNQIANRFLWVWDGLVAVPPSERKSRLWGRAFGKNKSMFMDMEPNGLIQSVIFDLAWRHDVRQDVVTFWPGAHREWLQEWCERENMPLTYYYAHTPGGLLRRLAYMPEVVRVFDPDPDRAGTWANVGTYWDPERAQNPFL